MASLTCFASPRSHDRPTGHETPEQIVRDAIQRARGAVIFYEGLKGFAQNFESRMMIDKMIREENRHIRLLSRSLEAMRSEQRPPGPPVPVIPQRHRLLLTTKISIFPMLAGGGHGTMPT